jgi:D-alanyl-D-alanine carboxypeptidase
MSARQNRVGTRSGLAIGRLVVVLLLAALGAGLLPSRPAAAQEQQPRPPAAGARAAIVVDAATGAVLYERNAHEPMHPASLTKMVTALVAVERAPLDRIVRVTHPIVVTPVLIGLDVGDELPLGEVLNGLLLNSGNDAALAIAESIGDGSIDRFVGWMNELAARLGLKDSHFVNPHGLDADGHLASAYDLAIIGRAVMEQPVLAKIVAQQRHDYEGKVHWTFRTRNPLLGVYDGVDGIKTGFDDLAGLCLVATAERDGRRAIAVVMNSNQYGEDAASLLDYAFADKRWGPVTATAPAPGRPMAGSRLAMLRADVADDAQGAPAQLLGETSAARATGDRGRT